MGYLNTYNFFAPIFPFSLITREKKKRERRKRRGGEKTLISSDIFFLLSAPPREKVFSFSIDRKICSDWDEPFSLKFHRRFLIIKVQKQGVCTSTYTMLGFNRAIFEEFFPLFQGPYSVDPDRSSLITPFMDAMKPNDVLGGCKVSETVNEDADASIEGHTNKDVRNLVNGKHIYREDVVLHNNRNMVGIVTEVGGDLDSESESTDDDESEDDDGDDDDDDGDNEEEEEEEEEEGEMEEEGAGKEEEENEEEDDGSEVENEEGDKVRNSNVSESAEESRNGGNQIIGSLSTDQVRVLWLDDLESTHNLNDVTVIDRGFLHGDYVASASNPTGQVGLVVDVNILVDLLTTERSIIKDVSTRDLKRVRDLTIGDFVVYGPWLGRVDDVLDNVTVLFDDGSVCKVMRADPLELGPKDKNSVQDENYPYYPGQRVRARSSSLFKNSLWSSGSWKANKLEGTVIKVTVGSVYIHWIASAGYGLESSSTPAEEQSPKHLKLLSCFTHANWQLGDWCLLPSLATSSSIPLENGFSMSKLQGDPGIVRSKCDLDDIPKGSNRTCESMDLELVSSPSGTSNCQESSKSSSSSNSSSVLKQPSHESWHIHHKKLRKIASRRDKKLRKKEETHERALLIANIKTRVDVAWQDGVIERQISSTSLIPVESPGDHDFVAEQYVVEKGNDDNEDVSAIRRVGVVKSVNSKEKTACVLWLKPVARPEDQREFDKEEIVSVYELDEHPDYDYCYGDVVVRLSPAPEADDANSSMSMEEQWQQGSSDALQCDVDYKKDNTSVEESGTGFSDLSWVGNITGLQNGDIEVTWADGMVSVVGPQAIYVVARDDDASTVAGNDISDAASWETVDDNEVDSPDNEKEVASDSGADMNSEAREIVVDGEDDTGRIGPLSIPLACIGFVTRLASGIFSRGRRHEESIEADFAVEKDAPGSTSYSNVRVSDNGSSSRDCSVIDNDVGVVNYERGEEVVEAEATILSIEVQDGVTTEDVHPPENSQAMDVCSFKHFDTAKDPLDHFFLDVNQPRNSGRKWLKKVQQDWNILQNNLPDGIYVRVYEDRIDLLRAVLVGAYGTPYQDGLFFFDFHLPSEYPDVPPSAHYHSGGWRINPNLYEEGKVCLSLLNTWTGRGNEVWDPKSSSILQVLVSLQGLVLNSKPYFNEAGYDKQIGTAEGEKNSLSYNENAFLLTCKTIMYLIRKPPKDFDVLVKDHFKYRGHYILKACDAYMKGYLIGSLEEDACLSDKSEANATSVGFKLMLAKIVPKLFTALSEVGADCHEFKHLNQT
ncbi:hypothetical protein V2J09_015561 [Rumex salicifolius]